MIRGFFKFTAHATGADVWCNPQHVVLVSPARIYDTDPFDGSWLEFVGRNGPFRSRESPAEIAQLIAEVEAHG